MRIESRIFLGLTLFCFVAAGVYALWTNIDGERIEVIGVTALILSGGLTGIIGSYFAFVARRIDARPEDRSDADIAEGAGELGFFSPASYWPFAIALAAATTGLGMAFWYYWLIALGGVALLVTIGGLLFEYYVGQNAQSS